MNPWIEAALIIAAFLAIVGLGTAWLIFWITADIDKGWPQWITYPTAAAPLLIALYATILHALTH